MQLQPTLRFAVEPCMYRLVRHLAKIFIGLKVGNNGIETITRLQGKFSQKIKIKLPTNSEMSKNVCPGWKLSPAGKYQINPTWSSWIQILKCDLSKDISPPQLCQSLGDSIPNDQMTICRPRWCHKHSRESSVNSSHRDVQMRGQALYLFTFLRSH